MDLKECERSGRIVAVWLALATGVRRGEALGLVWGNVDLTRKRIRIEKQLDSKGVRRDTKSHKSKRNLAIDDGTVAFLTEWKAMQSDLFYRGGDAPTAHPRAATTPTAASSPQPPSTSGAVPDLLITVWGPSRRSRPGTTATGSSATAVSDTGDTTSTSCGTPRRRCSSAAAPTSRRCRTDLATQAPASP